MPRLSAAQRALRLRLSAHLRRLFAEHRFRTQREMATKLDIDPGHFSALYNGQSEVGLDVAMRMHRVFGESLNYLCDDDPPARYFPPGSTPG